MKKFINQYKMHYFLYFAFTLLLLHFTLVDLVVYYKILNFHNYQFYHYDRMLIIAIFIIGFYNLANLKRNEK